jgi:hypothetical protein
MTAYVLLCVLSEIPNNYLHAHKVNNLFLMHLFTVIEFVLLAWAYSFHLSQVISRKAMLAIAIAFVVFALLNSLFLQPLHTFNSYAKCLECILILSFALVYVYLLLVSDEQRLLKTLPMFWINTAVLIYFTTIFFLFLLSNNMMVLPSVVRKSIWVIRGLLLSGYYFAIAKAIWIKAKQ